VRTFHGLQLLRRTSKLTSICRVSAAAERRVKKKKRYHLSLHHHKLRAAQKGDISLSHSCVRQHLPLYYPLRRKSTILPALEGHADIFESSLLSEEPPLLRENGGERRNGETAENA